ncbi:MAG: phosphoribosylglycinamide formyltransferase [Desulfohalobiaceae bacterium]|nr:phosphoribosylglycinamide formyltransferase [Desulfohalobiaceae bacterium]
MTLSVGVLLSGGGSNLQSIVDHIDEGFLEARIRVVLSNEPKAGGLARAQKHRIQTSVLDHRSYSSREEHDSALLKVLQAEGVEVVCLAGYMRLLGKSLVRAYPGRILNIHPALLPSFPGLDAQQQAADYGVRISGATVHFVDEFLDHGPIIIQGAVPAYPGEGRDDLARRILTLEHRIYPQALQWLARDRLRLTDGRVHLLPDKERSVKGSRSQPLLVNPPLEEGF